MKIKILMLILLIFVLLLGLQVYVKSSTVNVTVENSKNEILEKIVSLENINVEKVKKIEVEVSGDKADTINYDVSIDTVKKLSDKNNVLKIPIKYLIANQYSNVKISILVNNKKIIKKIKIKVNLPNKIKRYFPDIVVKKSQEIKNRAYCFVFWFALDFKSIQETIEFCPSILDSKGTVRSFLNTKVMDLISNLKKVPNDTSELKFDREREPIFLNKINHLIVFASNKNRKTITDVIVEIDLNNNSIVRIIDLTKILDCGDRIVQLPDWEKKKSKDWLHLNSMAYDENDDSVIVSARHQGIFKVGFDGKLKWILSPHKGWKKTHKKHLLRAVNSKNEILNEDVQNGDVNYKVAENEFEWCWGQHSVKLVGDGKILVFDNGFVRNFCSNVRNVVNYSRVVIYEINEENKTVKQIWQYGKELGKDFFTAFGCTVNIYDDNIFVNSGCICNGHLYKGNNPSTAVVKEIDIQTKEILTEFQFNFKNILFDKNTSHPWFDKMASAVILNIKDIK